MLYGANDQPIEETIQSNPETEDFNHIPSANFPPPTPKPSWFDTEIFKIGGPAYAGADIPRYRVVWGMDEKITQFAMGKMRMKYVAIIDHIQTTVGYYVIDTKKNRKRFIKPEEAHRLYMDVETNQMTKNVKPGELLVPVVTEEEREIGVPLWVVEQWIPPEAFGTKSQWEAERFLINPENTNQYIDALGDYPYNGAYIYWFDLIDTDEEGRETYRPLDEGAVELIRFNHNLNVERQKSFKYDTVEKRAERRDAKFDADWNEFNEQLTKDILDVKANRKFNITPKG